MANSWIHIYQSMENFSFVDLFIYLLIYYIVRLFILFAYVLIFSFIYCFTTYTIIYLLF